jgi:hypothetical protein
MSKIMCDCRKSKMKRGRGSHFSIARVFPYFLWSISSREKINANVLEILLRNVTHFDAEKNRSESFPTNLGRKRTLPKSRIGKTKKTRETRAGGTLEDGKNRGMANRQQQNARRFPAGSGSAAVVAVHDLRARASCVSLSQERAA